MGNDKTLNILVRVCAMEVDRIKTIQEALWECAVYLGCRLEAVQLREYAQELCEENISAYDVIYALKQIRKQPDRRRYGVPLPAEIINFIDPKEDEQDRANQIAASIQLCYSKFGHCNADKARAYMGEVAWEVVGQCGGWTQMCRGSDTDKRTEFAQLRDLARGCVRRFVHAERSQKLIAHRMTRGVAQLAEPELTEAQKETNRKRAANLIAGLTHKKRSPQAI